MCIRDRLKDAKTDVEDELAISGLFLGIGHEPVSYTHLDVYKRQLL